MMITPTAVAPVAIEPKFRKRMGAAKYSNVHHIKIRKK